VNAGKAITLTVVALVVLLAALFTVQNFSRLSDLSLDLGLVAMHLKQPQPLPVLMWGAFFVGLISGLVGAVLLGRGSRPERIRHSGLAGAGMGATSDDWS